MLSLLFPAQMPVVMANDLQVDGEITSEEVQKEVEETEEAENNLSGEMTERPPGLVSQAYKGKDVLFLTRSGSGVSITNTRSEGYSFLAQEMTYEGYDVSQAYINRINLSALFDYDIVIFDAYSVSSLNRNEMQAFESYVLNGGGLLLLGEMHSSTLANIETINPLAKRFGIEFIPGLVIQEDEYFSEPTLPLVTDFAQSPITEGVDQIFLNYGSAIKVTSPAKSIANSSQESWLEVNPRWNHYTKSWSYSKDSNDIDGPLSILASSEYGYGRVIAISDYGMLRNDWIYHKDFQSNQLARNMVNWLGEAKGIAGIELSEVFPTSALKMSNVMKGGKVLRYYTVTDSDGKILRNYTLQYRTSLSNTVYEAISDENGIITIVTPSLSKDHLVEIEAVNTNLRTPTKFNVKVSNRVFEQEYGLAKGVKGSLGLSGGPYLKVGPIKGQVGFTPEIGRGKGSSFSIKYKVNGPEYDFEHTSTIDHDLALSADFGLKGEIGKAAELYGPNASLALGGGVSYGFSNEYENFGNAGYRDYFTVYYYLLKSLMPNQPGSEVANYVLSHLEKKLNEVPDSHKQTFEQYLTGKAAADLGFGGGVKINNTEDSDFSMTLGIASAEAEGTASLKHVTDEKENRKETTIGLIGKAEADLFNINMNLPFNEKGDGLSFLFEENMLNKSFYRSSEAIIKRKLGQVDGVEFNIKLQEEATSNFYKNGLDSNIYRFKLEGKEAVDEFSPVPFTLNLLNAKYKLFDNDTVIMQQLLSADRGQLAFEKEKENLVSYSIPLELGIGLGGKVDLGVKAEGKKQLNYTAEKGVVKAAEGLFITEQYEYDDYIEDYQKDLTSFFNELGDKIYEDMKDVFDTIKSKFEASVEYVTEKGKLFIDGRKANWEDVKDSASEKWSIMVTTIKDLNPFSIQTTEGTATVLSEVFIVSANDENDEALSTFKGASLPITITYTDENVQQLNLAGKENKFAIYTWDAEEDNYVRLPSTLSKESNSVTANITKPGQYILAYNEVTPSFTDFTVKQNGENVAIQLLVKDSFETLSADAVKVFLNNKQLNPSQYEYYSGSGLLTMSLANLPNNVYEFMAVIEADGETFKYTKSFEKQSQHPVKGEVVVLEGDHANEVIVHAKVEQPVDSILLDYQVNGDVTKRSSYLLPNSDGTYTGTITLPYQIFDMAYTVTAVDKNNYHYKISQGHKRFVENHSLELVSTNLTEGLLASSAMLVLEMNEKISSGKSDLSQIVLTGFDGEELGIHKEIVGSKLIVTPAIDYQDSERYKLTVPNKALVGEYTGVANGSFSVEFTTYEKDDESLYAKNKPWTITFNDEVNPASVDNQLYILNLNTGEKVETSITHPSATSVKIAPTHPYVSGDHYIVVIDQGVKNKKGSSLKQKVVKSFIVE